MVEYCLFLPFHPRTCREASRGTEFPRLYIPNIPAFIILLQSPACGSSSTETSCLPGLDVIVLLWITESMCRLQGAWPAEFVKPTYPKPCSQDLQSPVNLHPEHGIVQRVLSGETGHRPQLSAVQGRQFRRHVGGLGDVGRWSVCGGSSERADLPPYRAVQHDGGITRAAPRSYWYSH